MHVSVVNGSGRKITVIVKVMAGAVGIARVSWLQYIIKFRPALQSSDKERKCKSDTIDARKISRQLSKAALPAIYIPVVEVEHIRTLVRHFFNRSSSTPFLSPCIPNGFSLLDSYQSNMAVASPFFPAETLQCSYNRSSLPYFDIFSDEDKP